MSIAHVKPRDALVTCPYNPSHRIENGRLPIHLIKCRKNHDTSRFTECPFNATHIIPFAEKPHHMAICPDRAVVERQCMHALKASVNTKISQDLLVEADLPQSVENWELEAAPPGTPGYDPTKHMQEQQFHNPNTFASMTKSQKKEFRQANNAKNAVRIEENENMVDRLLTAPLKELHLPKEDGVVDRLMIALSGSGSSLPSPSVSRQSTYRKRDNENPLLGISKGRGIYRVPDSLPRVGLELPLTHVEGRLPEVRLPSHLEFVNDCSSSTTGDDSDSVHSERLKNRLLKKIKQINVLVEMQENGETLNREELDKIAKRDEILKVLQLLPNK